jgi:hypothetical protein
MRDMCRRAAPRHWIFLHSTLAALSCMPMQQARMRTVHLKWGCKFYSAHVKCTFLDNAFHRRLRRRSFTCRQRNADRALSEPSAPHGHWMFVEAIDTNKFEPQRDIADFDGVLHQVKAFGYYIFEADG